MQVIDRHSTLGQLACVEIEIAKKNGFSLENSNFTRLNLAGTDFRGTYLKGVDFSGANLSNCNFDGVDLIEANLSESCLLGSSMDKTDLLGANLESAVLSDVDLKTANLHFADTTNAKMSKKMVELPEFDSFFGFKKLADGVVVRVEIPAYCGRVSTHKSKKCRAYQLRVVEIVRNPKNVDDQNLRSKNYPNFKYALHHLSEAGSEFDYNEASECAPGLHFFMTLAEALAY